MFFIVTPAAGSCFRSSLKLCSSVKGAGKKATTYPELTLIPRTRALLNFSSNVAVLSQGVGTNTGGKKKKRSKHLYSSGPVVLAASNRRPRATDVPVPKRESAFQSIIASFQRSTGRAGLCFTLPAGAFLVILFNQSVSL